MTRSAPSVLCSSRCRFPQFQVRLTCVYAYPEPQLVVGSVSDLECFDLLQQSQRHAGDLSGVEFPVAHRQPGHHHVGVADGLHLWERRGHVSYHFTGGQPSSETVSVSHMCSQIQTT